MNAIRIILIATGFVVLWPAQKAAAESACRMKFSTVLAKAVNLANSLPDRCWREAQRGRQNSEAIKKACNSSQIFTASEIERARDQMISICHSEECSAELKPLKVCVTQRPLQYYIDKIGLKAK